MSENKKVKNATPKCVNGIKFKSTLEAKAYELLLNAGLDPLYEFGKITLMEGFNPTIPFFKKASNNHLGVDNVKVRAITYTPDFFVEHNGYNFFIEIKGMKTDSYNIKVKLFRKALESCKNSVFFELHSIREIKEAIVTIENYG